MNKAVLFVVSLTLYFGITAPSQAAAILSISPDTQNVSIGSSVLLDVNISGLVSGTPLGGYDLDIGFNSNLLSFNQATFGDPISGDQLDVSNLGLNSPSATPGLGFVNLFEFSLGDPAALISKQASSFTLAVLSFNELAVGTSPITFSVNGLTDANANNILYSAHNGSVTVSADSNGVPTNTVPEPDALLLLIGGSLALRLAQRRHRFA